MTWTWVAVAITGMVTAAYGSRQAVRHATALAHGLKVPPYLIGVVILGIGTDIPEIANSILASAAGHGDLNVGDSVGSVATQITLGLAVIGLLGGRFAVGPARVVPVTLLTVLALVLGAFLTADGWFSRWDGLVLLAAWAGSTAVVWRSERPLAEAVMEQPHEAPLRAAIQVLGYLVLVGVGAAVVVRAVIELAPLVGIPEYVISFFGTSIGTSMPEIVVDVNAIRMGRRDLAVGDVLGSCLVDGTLSIGIGPALFPVAVTGSLAMRGAFAAIGAVTVAAMMLLALRRLDRTVGIVLLVTYLLLYLTFLAG
jgi:cation:H+ antiporter